MADPGRRLDARFTDGPLGALALLTRIPTPGLRTISPRRSLWWMAPVGALCGALAGVVYWLAASAGAEVLAAALAVGALALVSGGLHLDGLMDTADGLGVPRSAGRALEIMKDSHVGAFGVIACVVVLLVKVCALVDTDPAQAPLALLAGGMVSRGVLPALAWAFPYAREEGMARAFFRQAAPGHAALGLLLGLGATTMVGGGIVAGIVAVATGGLVALWARRRLGGITGDVLGACCEIVEASFLIGCALA